MIKIQEYRLLGVQQEFLIPKGAEFLSAQNQYEDLVLWFLVDDQKEPVSRIFRAYVTGEPLDIDRLSYLGTVQFNGGGDVSHVCEVCS